MEKHDLHHFYNMGIYKEEPLRIWNLRGGHGGIKISNLSMNQMLALKGLRKIKNIT